MERQHADRVLFRVGEVTRESLDGQAVTNSPEPGDGADCHRRHHTCVTPRFALQGLRKVHFNDRALESRQRIVDGEVGAQPGYRLVTGAGGR